MEEEELPTTTPKETGVDVVRARPTGRAWTQWGFEPMSWARVVSGVAMRQGGVARRLLTRVPSSAHPWHSSKPWGDAAVRAIANAPLKP